MKVSVLSMLNGSFDPYWRDVERGVEAAGKHFEINVDYMAPDFAGGTEQQVTRWQLDTVKRMARQGDIQAAAVAMLNFEEAATAVNTLVDAGIPCITFDTDAPDSKRSFYVGANNHSVGNTCAYVMARLLSFEGKVIVDAPSLNVQSCIARIAGFREVMGRYKNIQIVREVGGDENEASMRETARRTIQEIPDLAGMFCASGTTALINAEELKAAGKAGDVKIVCVDAGEKVLDMLRKDIIQMTIAQRPYSMGFRIMDYLYQIATRGLDAVMNGIPESRVIDTGIHQVTALNVDSFLETTRKLQS